VPAHVSIESKEAYNDTKSNKEDQGEGELEPATTDISELEAQLLLVEEKLQEEIKAARYVVPTVPTCQINPYLEHTQFQRCVLDMAWLTIREYVRPSPSL
jgi:hypothetical protein